MSIEAYLKRICINTAVYWSDPTANEDGVMQFTTPVEIKCFWKDGIENIIDKNGRETVSRAAVYLLQDVDEGGMLYFGELEDLTTAQKSDPRTVAKAYEIKLFVPSQSLHLKGEFNRKAML